MAYTDIDKPTDYFSTNLWVADDSSPRSFTGFGHQPDMVWTKHRGSANLYHTITDSVRGGDKMIAPNDTSAEDTKSHGEITSFNSDGITVADGTSATYPKLYFNDLNPFGAGGGNYVGWSWKAGGTASSNTDGSITSSVSANTTAGFSIVSYTGTGSNATVGHGLSSAPKMIIVKNRSTAGNLPVFHQTQGGTKIQWLNLTNATATESGWWNNTDPTSSVFSIGTQNDLNKSSDNIIAYCFAEKKGYSKFGSYTGNGSTDGTFVYTGFKPAWIMIKRTDSANNWTIQDSTRDPENPVFLYLSADDSDAEAGVIAEGQLDFLSNGFKLRQTYGSHNASGGTYIYMCFAENPFVTSTGIPACAR